MVGKLSVTVTAPLVGPLPLLVTVIVYTAPVCLCVKLPVWLLAIVRSGLPPPEPAGENTTSAQ